MTFSHRRFFPLVLVGIGVVCLTLAGCGEVDPPYSSLVKYLLRSDPLVISDKLGDERPEPDRPGQLPLFRLKDLSDPLHPIYPKRDAWPKENLLRDPLAIAAKDREELDKKLGELFGTPAKPTVAGIADGDRTTLKLDDATLEQGSRLYRVHCLHCHGVPGDGRGPTARWINPHPRDFRQGLFKFQSVDQTGALGRPPRRADLVRTLKSGIEGTAMPTFGLLPADDLEKLASYVIHLSIRGRVEFETFKGQFEPDENNPSVLVAKTDRTVEEYVDLILKVVAGSWVKSQAPSEEIKIAAYPPAYADLDELKKSVVRGKKLFEGIGEEGKAANCVSCHVDFGRRALFRFDAWGTLVRPNNLTNGIYRGGRRTIDIYYRIHSGINGSGMLAFGKALKSDDSVWDLVNFVQALPYPAMRTKLGINID